MLSTSRIVIRLDREAFMDDYGPPWFRIVVGILCFGAFVMLFLMLRGGLVSADSAIALPILVIIGVMALFATLALVAVVFSVAGLSDETQALGLPEGSVRAAIALSLIVIFAITSIYLYGSLKDVQEGSPGIDFAKQVFAVVGTLMTSVASFYFASRAAAAPTIPGSTPALASIVPTTVSKVAGPTVAIKILGDGLQLTRTVSFETSTGKVQATEVTSNEQMVKCEMPLDPALAVGKYNVVVTMSDGRTGVLADALEVTQ
jgi:hypothetical protein